MKNLMKPAVLLAAALLVTSTGIASAKTQHRAYDAGQTGVLSSTNIRDAAGPAGYAIPHEVPENGGAATQVVPGFTPN